MEPQELLDEIKDELEEADRGKVTEEDDKVIYEASNNDQVVEFSCYDGVVFTENGIINDPLIIQNDNETQYRENEEDLELRSKRKIYEHDSISEVRAEVNKITGDECTYFVLLFDDESDDLTRLMD